MIGIDPQVTTAGQLGLIPGPVDLLVAQTIRLAPARLELLLHGQRHLQGVRRDRFHQQVPHRLVERAARNALTDRLAAGDARALADIGGPEGPVPQMYRTVIRSPQKPHTTRPWSKAGPARAGLRRGIHGDHVGPAGRQASQRAGGIVKIHPVLTPRLPAIDQPKRLAGQRIERMGDPKASDRIVWTMCSRLLWPTGSWSGSSAR